MARAKTSSASAGSTTPRPFNAETESCRNPTWLPSMIFTSATSAGIRSTVDAGRPSLRRELHDDRSEVEDDRVPVLRDRLRVPLGDVDELLRGHAVGGLPQLLDARALQHLVHPLLRELAQRVGGRSGKRLQPRRQRVGDLARDVDVRVHLVDDDLRDLLADVVVAQQPRARVGPVVGVEHLAVRPDREDREERQQRADGDQPANEVAPPRGRRGVSVVMQRVTLAPERVTGHHPRGVSGLQPRSSGCAVSGSSARLRRSAAMASR